MKKRNMAITIAAVSAATSVAPALAFADTTNNQVIASTDAKAVAQLKTNIQNLLNVKYTEDKDLLKNENNAGNSVYTITYTTQNNNTAKNIKNMEDLDVALASLDKDNEFLNIKAVNNGYTTVNNQIVDYKTETYTQDEISQMYTDISATLANKDNVVGVDAAKTAVDAAKTAVEEVTAAIDAKTAVESAETALSGATLTAENIKTAKTELATAQTKLAAVEQTDENKTLIATAKEKLTAAQTAVNNITFKSNITDITKVDNNTVSLDLLNNETPLVLKTGENKVDLNAPEYKQDANGNYLGLNSEDKEEVLVGANKDNIATNPERIVTGFDIDKSTPADNAGDTTIFGVDYEGVITKTYKATDLYDFNVGRFTVEGNQLGQYIRDYNKANDTTVEVTTNDAVVSLNATGTELNIKFPEDRTKDMNGQVLNMVSDNPASGQYADITITGSSENLKTLNDIYNGTSNPKVNELAGMDRYQTAIQVSKAAFNDATDKTTPAKNANAVVLVSGNVLADGLTATPFAKQQNAPILLSDKGSVSDNTIREIQRVLPKGSTVYVIGGENTISKNVETQIKAKGYEIKRIKGDDRYETSLKIAQKMEETNGNNKQVYVTGGYADADSMSIAAVGAMNESPILLANPNTGLSADQIDFLKAEKNVTPYIIGGADRAPEVIKTQIKDEAKLANPERLSGEDRQGTNAAVIKEFYKDSITNLYVAKSDNKGLVDSLSAGVLAGAKETTPVVLATNDLNASQKAVVKSIGLADDVQKTQIGYGIAAQVWTTITNIFTK